MKKKTIKITLTEQEANQLLCLLEATSQRHQGYINKAKGSLLLSLFVDLHISCKVGIDNIIEKIKFENFKNNTRCFTKLSALLIRFFRLNK